MADASQVRKEKRTVRKTVNLRETVALALEEAASHEERSFSRVIERALEKDPTVRIFIQRVELTRGRS